MYSQATVSSATMRRERCSTGTAFPEKGKSEATPFKSCLCRNLWGLSPLGCPIGL